MAAAKKTKNKPFVVNRTFLLTVALAFLALSLVFLSWVLQLTPAGTLPEAESAVPPVGRVSAEILPTPTPAYTPQALEYCTSLPSELRQDCLAKAQNANAEIPSSPADECAQLPSELQQECLAQAQKP